MNIDNPMRLGGLAALVAGVLLIISQIQDLYLLSLFPVIHGHYFEFGWWIYVDEYLGTLLSVVVQLGLVGLYARQARAAGILGVVGFFMAFIGVWLAVGTTFTSTFVKPSQLPAEWGFEEFWGEESFWGTLLLFAVVFVLGWVLFGVATLKTGIYPRAASALLIAGTLALLLPLPLSGVIFAVALVWMGYTLFTQRAGEAG